MPTADEFAKGFGQQSRDDKNESFEASTLKEVLKQIGWTASQVRIKAEELDAAFGWDWFNGECLLKFTRVGSIRVFNYTFLDLLTKPASHPLTVAFRDFKGPSNDPCCLVFKVYDHGRWVATNLQITEDSCMHIVTGPLTFSVLPFPKFFQRRWGDTNDQA